jgi:3-phosphoglycerate kinase
MRFGVTQLDPRGRRVFMRADFGVPLTGVGIAAA